MNQTDPLANLRDIHLPEAISWWPLAPGWWVVIILLCAVTGYLCARLFKRHQRRLYRRQALLRLQQIEGLQGQKQLVELFETLKRTAISAYPNQSFANLSSADFIGCLKNTCKAPIFQQIPDNLEAMLYGDQTGTEQIAQDFFNSAIIWIKKHPEQVSWEHPPC